VGFVFWVVFLVWVVFGVLLVVVVEVFFLLLTGEAFGVKFRNKHTGKWKILVVTIYIK
jgi:hypothetical protein